MAKSKIKILFIDDESDACRLFKKIVEKEGYSVLTAVSGKKGLEIYKRESPSIVFLDIKIPDVDGITLLNEIKKINQRQIVIIITGYGDLRSARAALRLGACDYVSKPLDINLLKNSIKDALTSA